MTTLQSVIEGPAGAGLGRVLSLSGREARRLARHPSLWLVLAVTAVGAGSEAFTGAIRTAGFWYNTVFVAVAFLGPMVMIFAAHLVASGARRVRAEEVLGVTPMSDTERTLAMCLGVAFTLGGIGAAGALVMSVIAANGSVPATDLKTAAELAQIPAILAGGGLLGVLTARWLRFPGAALVTFVVFVPVAVFAFAQLDLDTGTWLFWWSTSTPVGDLPDTGWVPLSDAPTPAGRPAWHAPYLVGLCVCATMAAVYRDRAQWTKLVAVGLPVAAVTALLGWLQLP